MTGTHHKASYNNQIRRSIRIGNNKDHSNQPTLRRPVYVIVLSSANTARAIAVIVAAIPSIRFDAVSRAGFTGLQLSPPCLRSLKRQPLHIGW
jgi:hypothetical protein